jgi:hypothetical protein
LCPCSWYFESFSPVASAVFLRDGYAGNVTPCRVLVMVQITSFLFSVRGLELQLYDGGVEHLLQSQRSVLCLCALWKAGLLAPAE